MIVYDINPSALKNYYKNVKNGADASKEAVKRKLSALIASTDIIEKVSKNITVYSIGTFRICVKNGIIEWVMWTKKNIPVSKETGRKIRCYYSKLGLTNDGSKIINGNIDCEQVV